MNKEYFSIGEISKMMNITVKALRFYDKIGLLKPEYINPQTKYRYYHVNQLIYIVIIKAARNMDISPLELIPHFKNKNSEELIKLIQDHKKTLYDKMYNLERTIEGLEAVSKTLDMALNIDKSGEVYIKNIAERHVITIPFDFQKPQEDILLDFYHLNALGNKRNLIQTYEEGIVYQFKDNEILPEFIFTTILKKENFNDYKKISSGDYVCAVFTQESAVEQYEKIFEYISNRSLQPQFLVQTELMTDVFADQNEYFEFQIKI